jgi:hypothetical protein
MMFAVKKISRTFKISGTLIKNIQSYEAKKKNILTITGHTDWMNLNFWTFKYKQISGLSLQLSIVRWGRGVGVKIPLS